MRILVLTGSGGPGHGFLPGADLQHMISAEHDHDARTIEQDPRYAAAYRVPAMLHDMPQVTVAAIALPVKVCGILVTVRVGVA